MLENRGMVSGTLSLNVPVAYAMLLEAFQTDTDLKRHFLRSLDLIYYSGASLPIEVSDGLDRMAV